jgi:hypothetical protein
MEILLPERMVVAYFHERNIHFDLTFIKRLFMSSVERLTTGVFIHMQEKSRFMDETSIQAYLKNPATA